MVEEKEEVKEKEEEEVAKVEKKAGRKAKSAPAIIETTNVEEVTS